MSLKIVKANRPYYSPARICLSLKNRAKGINTPPQIGFYFSVNYSQSGRPAKTLIRDIDSIYFSSPTSGTAREHLKLILSARKGNSKARDELALRQAANLAEFKSHISDPLGIKELEDFKITMDENAAAAEYLVPSTSTREFPKSLVGDKGYNLLMLTKMGFPVPAFCIITSNRRKGFDTEKTRLVEYALRVLEELTGKKYDDPDRPLVFSLRSCLPENVPGIMPTLLNLGATERAMPALIERYGPGAYDMRIGHLINIILEIHLRWDEYKPMIKEITTPYPKTVLEKRKAIEKLEKIIESNCAMSNDTRILDKWASYIAYYFFRENHEMLSSFMHSHEANLIYILQEMIAGKLEGSFSGVFHTREPKFGTKSELLVAKESWGDEIMTGGRKPRVATLSPETQALQDGFMTLEGSFGTPVTIELAEERGMLGVLQANETPMSAPAALKTAIEMHKNGRISRSSILNIFKLYHLKQLLSDSLVIEKNIKEITRGTSILPFGDVMGKAYFTEEAALEAKARGEKVVWVKESFEPDDVDAMRDMDGLVSISSAAAHTIAVSRKYGIISLINPKKSGSITKNVKEGDFIVISSEQQTLFLGKAKTKESRMAALLRGTKKPRGEEKEFVSQFEDFLKLINEITIDEIKNPEMLADLVDFLIFTSNDNKAREIANKWFNKHLKDLRQFFLNTKIGQHVNKLALFRQLTPGRAKKLISSLTSHVGSEENDTYIAGRLLIVLDELIGKEESRAFINSLSEEKQAVLEEDRNNAEKYVEVASIQPEASSRRTMRTPSRERLVRKYYEGDMRLLTPEEIKRLRHNYANMDIPEHKPRKYLRNLKNN